MKYYAWYWWILLMLILAGLYSGFAFNLPQGVHSWAQSDRYALACMYFEDARFFHASTFNQMSEGGRVGVELPVLPYVSARIAHLVGRNYLPLIMKFLNLSILMWSIIFISSKVKGTSLLRNGLLTLLLFSPILMYYGFNFLPDSTAFALVIFAFANLMSYSNKEERKHWILAVMLSGFAAAIKTTCGIYFIAICAGLFLKFIVSKDYRNLFVLISIGLVITTLIVAFDYFYFYKVNKDYWSIIFMSESQPITNFNDLNAVYKGFKYWGGQWITTPQIIIGCLLLLFYFFNRKSETSKSTSLLGYVLTLSIIGVLAFILLMGKQFINHDYYFISAILPLLFLSYIMLHNQVYERLSNRKSQIYSISLAMALVVSGISSFAQFRSRNESHFNWKNREILNDNTWMKNGDNRLTAAGVDKSAMIFVLYEFSPNTPLVYFNRKGKVFNHEEMTREPQNMQYWLDRIKPEYILFKSEWVEEFKRRQPLFWDQIQLYKQDHEMMVFVLKPDQPKP